MDGSIEDPFFSLRNIKYQLEKYYNHTSIISGNIDIYWTFHGKHLNIYFELKFNILKSKVNSDDIFTKKCPL